MVDPIVLRKDDVEKLLAKYQTESDQSFVTAVYQVFLGREPDCNGLVEWSNQAAKDRKNVVIAILGSQEYLNSDDHYESLLEYAEQLIEESNWEQAEEVLSVVYKKRDNNIEISKKLGLCCWKEKKYEEAFDYYQVVYRELPKDLEVILPLIQLLLVLSEDRQALKLLGRFIAFNPKNCNALLILAKIYELSGRTLECEQISAVAKQCVEYRADIKKDIEEWVCDLREYDNQRNRGLLNDRISKSLTEFETDLGNSLYNVFQEIGDPAEVIKNIGMHLERYPNDVSAKAQLAFNYYLIRDLECSKKTYQEIEKIEPYNHDVLTGLLYVYEEEESYRELKYVAEKLLIAEPQSELAQERLLLANRKLCLEPGHRLVIAQIEKGEKHIQYLDGWYDEEVYRGETFRWSKEKSTFRLIIPEGSNLNKQTLCLKICEQCWKQRRIIVRYEDGKEFSFYTRFYSGFIYKVPYDQKSTIITLEVHPYLTEGKRQYQTGLSLSDAYITDDDLYYCELLPIDLVIETSTICNLRCVMCPHSLKPENKNNLQGRDRILDKKIYKKIESLVKQGQRIQLHSIGEPLLSEMFWKLLEIVPKNVEHVSVNTNFLLADEKKMDKILDSNLKYIIISVDAAREETYKKIRRSDLKGLKEKIRMLVNKRNQRNSKLRIIINMTVMKENIGEIVDFIKMGHFELGCDSIEAWPLNNNGDIENKRYRKDYDGWTFDYEEQGPWNFKDYYNEKIDEAVKYAKQHSIEFKFVKFE